MTRERLDGDGRCDGDDADLCLEGQFFCARATIGEGEITVRDGDGDGIKLGDDEIKGAFFGKVRSKRLGLKRVRRTRYPIADLRPYHRNPRRGGRATLEGGNATAGRARSVREACRSVGRGVRGFPRAPRARGSTPEGFLDGVPWKSHAR